MNKGIRPPCAAGTFYPGAPNRLRSEILARLAKAGDCQAGGVIAAAAVPHAGYVYSADIAAPVFNALKDIEFDTIVVIGHDFGRHAPGIIAVLPECEAFSTPLGNIEVDVELCDALARDDRRIVRSGRVHASEHSIEVQLPFIQTLRPKARLIPLLFGEVTPEHCRRLAELLQANAGNRNIFVLSSTDLSHYPEDTVSRQLDAKTVSFAENLDLEGLCRWSSEGDWENIPGVDTPICSAGGLGTAIEWAKMQNARKVTVLKRGNSSDAGGGEDRVVGYASMIFHSEA